MRATQIPVGRRISQVAILVAFASTSLMVVRLVARQPAGLDFLCFWIGGRVALSAPERLYDFQYVTQLQDLPFVAGTLRPYINPPSALLLFAPLSRLPPWAAYVGLMLAGVAVALAATVYAIDAAFGVLSLAAALALPLKGVRLLDDRPLLAGE